MQYIIECLAFQILFLIIYDLFLKRETFFQWNRVYLLGTYVLSLLLPWIKVDAFKNSVPEQIMAYPEIWLEVDSAVNIVVEGGVVETSNPISWWTIVFYAGMVLATILFMIKIVQIYRFRRNGEITYFKDFTRVLVSKSNTAFSFFKTIFIGDKIQERERQSIVAHELVHIKQKHSLDLLFFEFFRIVNWFNPLVYVYQSRISELHEFIADANVAKTHKKEQYQLLLSQVFQTENISFINHFFKSSLIKKRIVMLQKSKSKKIWSTKYLLLLPMVLCILFYTSSKGQEIATVAQEQVKSEAELIKETNIKIDELVKKHGSLMRVKMTSEVYNKDKNNDIILEKTEFFEQELIRKRQWDRYSKMIKDSKVKKLLTANPTTEKFNTYVNNKQVYQKLDKNLKISFNQLSFSLKIKQPNTKVSKSYKIINVENTKDLTGVEVIEVNRTISDIEQNNTYKGIVVTDGSVAIEATFKEKEIVETNEKIETKVANSNQEIETFPFSVVEDKPIFPGCEDATDKFKCFQEKMFEHIKKNFNYPKKAQEEGLQGKVFVSLKIMEDGTIGNLRKRGPSKILEEEAVRIIEKLPKMTPAKHKGKNVRVPFSLPITFKLKVDKTTDEELEISSEKYIKESLKQMEIDSNVQDSHSDVFPLNVVDEAPVFPGCENAENGRDCFETMVEKHIKKHFNYPKEAQEKGQEGKVYVAFAIQKDGTVGKIKVRGPHKILEDEAARIISKLPKMHAGKQNGKVVMVIYMSPITFKLQ